uniref:Ubiquitin-like domain-containing protein n=1 Tax=Mycena chlorophos TaxID=658473 RepID=A0ABQ0KVS8_MYCCL|nr:predicted protein [Mycena chlorophos]
MENVIGGRSHVKNAHRGRETRGSLNASTELTLGASALSITSFFALSTALFFAPVAFTLGLAWLGSQSFITSFRSAEASDLAALCCAVYVYCIAFCFATLSMTHPHVLNVLRYQTFKTPWRFRRDDVSHIRVDRFRRLVERWKAGGVFELPHRYLSAHSMVAYKPVPTQPQSPADSAVLSFRSEAPTTPNTPSPPRVPVSITVEAFPDSEPVSMLVEAIPGITLSIPAELHSTVDDLRAQLILRGVPAAATQGTVYAAGIRRPLGNAQLLSALGDLRGLRLQIIPRMLGGSPNLDPCFEDSDDEQHPFILRARTKRRRFVDDDTPTAPSRSDNSAVNSTPEPEPAPTPESTPQKLKWRTHHFSPGVAPPATPGSTPEPNADTGKWAVRWSEDASNPKPRQPRREPKPEQTPKPKPQQRRAQPGAAGSAADGALEFTENLSPGAGKYDGQKNPL